MVCVGYWVLGGYATKYFPLGEGVHSVCVYVWVCVHACLNLTECYCWYFPEACWNRAFNMWGMESKKKSLSHVIKKEWNFNLCIDLLIPVSCCLFVFILIFFPQVISQSPNKAVAMTRLSLWPPLTSFDSMILCEPGSNTTWTTSDSFQLTFIQFWSENKSVFRISKRTDPLKSPEA